jgi:hypothetical protein
MSLVRPRACLRSACSLAGTILLVWTAPHALGQDRLPWTDPPAAQAPASPQPEANQPTPPAREPVTSSPARQPDPVRPAAAPVPAAPPTSKVARPTSSSRQTLRAEPRTAPAPRPRTRAATLPRAASVPQPIRRRAEPRREERSRVFEAQPRPSFDCGYARTPVEQAICADPVLAAKDRHMALLYEQRGGSRFRPVDERQWRWLAAREACGRAPRAVLEVCIARTYDARIAELSGFQ